METKQGRKIYIKALQEADAGKFKEIEKIIEAAIKESIEKLENKS